MLGDSVSSKVLPLESRTLEYNKGLVYVPPLPKTPKADDNIKVFPPSKSLGSLLNCPSARQEIALEDFELYFKPNFFP